MPGVIGRLTFIEGPSVPPAARRRTSLDPGPPPSRRGYPQPGPGPSRPRRNDLDRIQVFPMIPTVRYTAASVLRGGSESDDDESGEGGDERGGAAHRAGGGAALRDAGL